MLHILLLILKIIGIILAVLLGILLLCVCIILFVPVCYRAEGASRGALEDAELHGRISWLFGLVKVTADIRNKKLEYSIRAAWKKFGGKPSATEEREEILHEEEEDTLPEIREEAENDTEPEMEEAEIPEEAEQIEKVTPKVEQASQTSEEIPEEEPGSPDEVPAETEPHDRISGIPDKIRKVYEKIKCTFREFCDKIKALLEKKDRVAEFIKDEIHVRAFVKGKREVFKLLRRLSPKVLKANIRYGFEDPGLTGRVLAGLSVLYPFADEHMQITPDFQEKVFEGEVQIRGRIYVVHLAALAVNMLLCKEVRRTIRDIKEFKL